MRRIHYAWVIAASGLIITAVAVGMSVNCFSLFVIPVSTDLGFTRAQMGVCQTINALGFAVTALFSGWLFRKINLNTIMRVSVIVMASAYFCYSRATKLWMFYLCAVFGSTSASLLTWVPLSVVIGNWFEKKRAFAIGFSFMGSGVGGMIFSSAGSRLIESIGWRHTFVVMAVVIAVVLIPLLLFVVRAHPSDKGMKAYGESEGEGASISESEKAGTTIKEAARNVRLYGILFFVLVFGIATNGFTATFVPHLEDVGYTRIRAGELYSVYMLILAIGKVLTGSLFDFFGAKKTTLLGTVLMVVTLTGLIFAKYSLVIAVMLVCSGVGNCFSTVGLPVLARAVYGKKDYASFTGIFNTVGNIGSTLAPTYLGLLRDASGSYSFGYLSFVALLVISGVCVMMCIPKRKFEKI